jgi:predicted transcriptional regulator
MTPTEIEEARKLAAEGVPHTRIAARFGVNQNVIARVTRGLSPTQSNRKRFPPETVERARELRAAGVGVKAIAKMLGTTSSTVSVWTTGA